MLPAQTEGLAPSVIVGVWSIVTVIGLLALIQPVVLFDTIMLAEYIPGTAPAGTVNDIGVAGSAAFTTSTKPCASAAAL